MSDAEPELGLGIVISIDERSVVLAFASAGETRRYALRSAPLRRVRFAAGDTVTDDQGRRHRIERVHERDGLLVYASADAEIAEAMISDQVALTSPSQRLIGGRVDAPAKFDLRMETLERLHAMRKSPLRGFVGPRVELLPHQFFIASEVTARLAPRVLLADETGLGKTIEAGLVLSRLLLSGRASRVLVLVPESLVHQWLVELRRRFQLRFSIYDEARCKEIEKSDPGDNPFLQAQLVLAGLPLVAESPQRTWQAGEAGWDLVVVDEAHHLQWTRRHASAQYQAVEAIAGRAVGLMLITATPQQLGEEGHFARLRLLDPDRYDDFDRWIREAGDYREVAAIARELIAGNALEEHALQRLAEFLGVPIDEVTQRCADAAQRSRLLEDLIDRHGPGRVMFRNTRVAVAGFPDRRLHRIALQPPTGDEAWARRLHQEIEADLCTDIPAVSSTSFLDDDAESSAETSAEFSASASTPLYDLAADARIVWLVELLSAPEPAKVLVLCRSAAKAQAIKAAVERRINVTTALFHEDLTLVQRDRNAAWFAQPDGARLLICSELGSEGRNFQHAQNLVMFDLPADPDLVEQRIGRLDRIGQRGLVHIHVPAVVGSGLEVLARWHDEGVDAFRRPTLAALPLLERFGETVKELALRAGSAHEVAGLGEQEQAELRALVSETQQTARSLAARVEEGRDRLLEMASLRRDVAAVVVDGVRAQDKDEELDDYLLRLLEHFGVYAEELGVRTYLLNPDAAASPDFPSLQRGETGLTFDRAVALVREDLEFMTCDHPLLGDAMELLLASESGNAVFAVIDGDGGPPRLLLEAVFVLESVAPPRLHVDRFLPPTPIRVVVDQHRADSKIATSKGAELHPGRGRWLIDKQSVLGPAVAKMTARCEALAEIRAAKLRTEARTQMARRLGDELKRLRGLAAINDHIRADEERAMEAELEELGLAIDAARLRPDALRLVWQGPSRDGVPVTTR